MRDVSGRLSVDETYQRGFVRFDGVDVDELPRARGVEVVGHRDHHARTQLDDAFGVGLGVPRCPPSTTVNGETTGSGSCGLSSAK